jgi:peptidyl-prolyl cis-trans isomerase D
MLNLFRKHATSWLIKVTLFLIVIVFIFWGGYAYKSKQETQIARVDDEYISIPEYNTAYDQMVEVYRRQLGSSFSEDLLRQFNLKKQALDVMINRIILTKAAGELGLTATNQEVRQKILDYPVFQSDGKFDQKRYNFLLRQNRMTPEAFEEQMRVDLTSQKVEQFIKRRAVVSQDEVLADFQFHFSQVQLAYVLLDPKTFEDKVPMEEKALQTYYQEHQDQYKEPEKRRIAVVLFKSDSYSGDVKLSDDEIRQYYEDNQEEFHKEAEVRARHILFPLKENAPEEEINKVRAEALKVQEEAKKGKDFAELAKKYSKDTATAKQGGDLGYFTRERMEPAFSDAAFSLKPGDISDLVRTKFGFHIIKVEDVRPEKTESLDEARPKIEAKLKEEKARDLAFKKARDFADHAYSQRDIEKAAKALNLDVAGADTWVAKSDSLPGIEPTGPAIMGKLFDLKDKETSGVIEAPQGFMVAQVLAVQPPQVIPFENVKNKVGEQYKTEQGRMLAKEKGAQLLEGARKEKSLDSAAKEMGLQVDKTDWFSRREPDKSLKLTGDSLNGVFQLEENNPFPAAVLDSANRYLICQLLGRKAPDKDLEKERPSILKRIEQQKQMMIWQGWVDAQRQKAHIEVYKEL